ncbi:MAG: energy-coupling factor transporter transmembrane component T [Neobacillus sp.]
MENRLERFHPLVPFLYYGGALSLFLLFLHPVFLPIGFILLLIINYMQDRLTGIRTWLFLMLTTVVLIMVMNPLFNERGRHLLFMIAEHRITLEAVIYGGMNALSIVGVMTVFISYNLIMTPNKLLFLFAKFLPQFAVLLMLTLRFIPLMRRRLDEIMLVQQSKGLSVTHGPLSTKLKNGMLYVQALLTYSLEEAIQTADSMKARGYGIGHRTSYEYFKIKKADMSAIIYLSILLITILVARLTGYGFLSVYPVMESWQLAWQDMVTLIFYMLFLSFPLLVEIGELFRWRLSK